MSVETSMPTDREVAREVSYQRAAKDAAQIVFTRRAIWVLVAMMPIMASFTGYVGTRAMNTLDTVVEKQGTFAVEVGNLKTSVNNLITNQTADKTTMNTRIDEVNRNANSRLDAQSSWIQRLSDKFDTLSRFVYSHGKDN